MIAQVRPAAGPLRGRINAPPSKNYTTRYALAAALARGESRILHPAVQDDAAALLRCLRSLGAQVHEEPDLLRVTGFGDSPRLAPGADIDPGNAGAVLRMLMGAGALLEHATFTTRHAESLGRRPNRDLLDALSQLGVEWSARTPEGCLPVTLRGGRDRLAGHLAARRAGEGIPPGHPVPVRVSGAVSSQFVSALLFLAPLLDEDVAIEVTGEMRSVPLIGTTLGVLSRAGITVESSPDLRRHVVRRGQAYQPRTWETNGDWPGAASILSAAAVVPGSEVSIAGLVADDQGERRCLDYFASAGAAIQWHPTGNSPAPAEIRAGTLVSTTIDGDLCTDAVLAMMATAVLARGTSRFEGIRNLQFKECDRVREPIAELRRIYATTPGLDPEAMLRWEPQADPDAILVTGAPGGFEGGIEVDGRGDHRVIMMLSVVGLRCRLGLSIRGAEHVSKSFPGWFDTLRAIGAEITFHGEGQGR